MNNEIIKFVNGDLQLDVGISPEQNTVWLTVDQICQLFDKNKSTISRHIKNIFSEGELDENSSVAKNATQLNRFDPRNGKLARCPKKFCASDRIRTVWWLF